MQAFFEKRWFVRTNDGRQDWLIGLLNEKNRVSKRKRLFSLFWAAPNHAVQHLALNFGFRFWRTFFLAFATSIKIDHGH